MQQYHINLDDILLQTHFVLEKAGSVSSRLKVVEWCRHGWKDGFHVQRYLSLNEKITSTSGTTEQFERSLALSKL